MQDSSYLKSIQRHPNRVEVAYKTTSTQGVLDLIPTEVFDNGIRRIYEKKLSVLTSKIAPITKNTDPTILIDGNSFKIVDHYAESKFITILVLQ